MEILTGGFVQSFVDFFYLQHKDDKANEDKAGPSPQTSSIIEGKGEESVPIELRFIQEKLTQAEKARRGGAPTVVFDNYRDLASAFCKKGDYQTGTIFYEKCLKISQLVDDVTGEKEARYLLGITLQRLSGMTAQSIEHLERFVELSTQNDDSASTLKGRQQLAIVYDKRAQELEAMPTSSPKDQDVIVDYLERVVRIASEEKNASAKAQANSRLGRAFNVLGKPERAIVALSQSFDYFDKSNNLASKGLVCELLAEAYLQMQGKTQKAIEYLEQSLGIAQQTYNPVMEASACRSLGLVHSEAGSHEEAVRYFEQNFELVCKHQSKENRIMDDARVLLGLAMRNARKSALMRMVQHDVASLLDWRIRREFPTSSTNAVATSS